MKIKYRMLMAGVVITLVSFAPVLLAQVGQNRKNAFVAVSKGALKPNSSGVVALPNKWASASRDGKAYVTHQGSLLMVFFPTWFGKGANVQGYLMCNQELNCETVEIRYPMMLGRGYGIGSNRVNIERKLSGHAYFVLYNLD